MCLCVCNLQKRRNLLDIGHTLAKQKLMACDSRCFATDPLWPGSILADASLKEQPEMNAAGSASPTNLSHKMWDFEELRASLAFHHSGLEELGIDY